MLLFYTLIWIVAHLTTADHNLASFTNFSCLFHCDTDQLQPTGTNLTLSFHSPVKYGMLFAVFEDISLLFSLTLRNTTLTLDTHYHTSTTQTTVCSNCWDTSHWNNLSVTLLSNDTVSIFIKDKLYQFQIRSDISNSSNCYYFGGLPPHLNIKYLQFYGYMSDIYLHNIDLLSSEGTQLQHVELSQYNPLNPPSIPLPLRTITVNRTDIRFPVTYTSFSNFSISFEFKSPENLLQILSFQLKQYFLSLRKDYRQVVLELNLHGAQTRLAVEITSQTEWVPVSVVVSDNITLLSSGSHNNEVVSRLPLSNKRFNKRALYFGGYRGCLRNVVLNSGSGSATWYDTALSQPGTLVGCHYPTLGCTTIHCPYSCSQSWDETKCSIVGKTLPKFAEFAGFGIIEANVPALINEQEGRLAISLLFVSQSSKDEVLLSLKHNQDHMAAFLIIQMLEGYLMLSLSFTDVYLNTDVPLNDGLTHRVTVSVTPTDISFQVDTKTWRKPHDIDMAVFRYPTSIKIGGSSLKLNNHRFTGCLSEVRINEIAMLERITRRNNTANVVIQPGVQLTDQCSLIKVTDEPHVWTKSAPVTSASSTVSNKLTYLNDTTTASSPSPAPSNITISGEEEIRRSEAADEQLLIGLMLGMVTLLAIVVFLVYFLWQRRQINSEAKNTSRKDSDELDEELINKTYNPNKQDKYTLFTPHALDAIEEESERGSSVNLDQYVAL